MAAHTIYVKDMELWNKAKELAKLEGISLSSLISRELAIWIEKKMRSKREIARDFGIAVAARDREKCNRLIEELLPYFSVEELKDLLEKLQGLETKH